MVNNRPDINQVLSQMRSMQSQIQNAGDSAPDLKSVNGLQQADPTIERADFAAMLKDAVDNVNSLQQDASQLAKAYERGDENVDLPQVMIGLQKSSVSFEAMTQVRNKLVDAYEKIMNMPI
ncbi:flagellar hook-basal body complex protein FliE [Marinomonas agarivorans]|nr:flagellar hook-basal body complex protein FliE [Marinomonas agarivorans]